MKSIFKWLDHNQSHETQKEVESMTNEETTALFLTIPKSIHAKFKAYSALKGENMQDVFVDWVEGLKFKDVTRQ